MENSTWQSKCGPSMWLPSTASLPSSSQLPSQPPQNQELISSNLRMAQEATLSWNSDLNFGNPGCPDLGRSNLSLLLRRPSLLEWDLQPTQKIIASCNTPVNSNKPDGSASGIGLPLLSSGLLTSSLDRLNEEVGADVSSSFSSKAGFAKCSSRWGLNNVLPFGSLNNFQNSEQLLPIINQKVPSTERAKESFQLREGSISVNTHGNIGNFHNGTDASGAPSSGCPRVFCLGISGYLLSRNGLLGVVCSCHGMHMSVSSFTEHSGLCNANPGDAVLMGSGETIAQWRKDYLRKFGISVPGDHSGWDWSERFPVAASKHIPAFPVTSISSDVSFQVNSMGASHFSGLYFNNVSFPEHPKFGGHMVDNFSHDEKRSNSLQGHCFPLKGLNSTSLSNYDFVTNKKVTSHSVTGGSIIPSSVGARSTVNVCQSTPDYKDSNSKFPSSFISITDMQNLKCLRKSFNGMNSERSVMYRDSVNSNFELRLGQPSVQRQTLESSSLLAPGSYQIRGPSEAKSSALPGQLHKLDDSMVGMSEYILKREHSRFHQNHLPGGYSSTRASQADNYEGSAAKVSAIPVLLSHLKHAENVHPDASKIVMNGSKAMAGKEHCELHLAKGDNFVPWVRGRRMDKEFSGNELYGKNKNCQGVGGGHDYSIAAAKQDSTYSTKLKGGSFLNEVMGGSGHNKSCLDDRSLNTWQFSGMKANASDVKWLGKISYPENHVWSGFEFPKRVSSRIDSGTTLASQAVSVASSCTISNSSHGPYPAFSNKGSICARQRSVNDSLQKLASQQLPEFTNHRASLETIPGQRMFNKYCEKKQDSIPLSASKEQCYGSYCACTPCSSGSPLGYWIGAENDKLAPVADLTKHFNCSALSKGKSLPTGGAKMLRELSRVTYLNEQSLLRFSENQDKINLPNLPEKCVHADPGTNFQGKSRAMGTNGLKRSYDFKDGTSAPASKELAGNGTSRPTNQMYGCPNESSSLQDIGLQEVECTSFQWRDVPKKMEEIGSQVSKELPGCSVSGNGDDASRTPNAVAAYANCFNTSAQDAESQKEQEVSGISSCSAPVVTQVSIGIDNNDSPTVDAADTRYRNNFVVDEASGIDRCSSSDDAPDSQSAGFCRFVSTSYSMDVGQTDRVHGGSSHSLVDEIRLRDSLRLNKMQNPCPSFTIQEKSNHGKMIEICSRKRKRRTIKWKRLNASFPPSSQSFTCKGSPKLTGSNEWHSYALKDVDLLLRNDQRSSSICTCSAEPCSKPRKSALSSAICLERDFHKIHRHVDADIHNQTKKKINHDDLGVPEVIRRKRLRLASAEPTINEVHINESSVVDAEKTDTSFGNQVNVSKKVTRPMVCGKYGIISNGNPLKPAKILCMKRILMATESSSVSAHAKWHINSVKSKKSNTTKCNGGLTKPSSVQKDIHSRVQDVETNRAESSHVLLSELNRQGSLGEPKIASLNGGKEIEGLSRLMKKRSDGRCGKNKSARSSCLRTHLKTKSKEIRKRSLYELTVTGKDSSSSNFSIDTTSAFGASGASLPNSNVVCSICTRQGGSCIKCRVADCSVYFHPWCARQKGLLQSEVEGANEENFCLYGQCMDHAIHSQSNFDDYPAERKKEFTCARTEGYKGCKRDGSQHVVPHCPDSSNGCHVPQEQLNAWLHINGQRPFPIGQPKLSKLEIEHDHRKEYARYKQSKGWKHLVVYKSGIHGLGLYTSQFISRGAMVVEYVGEIVGPRVADKRESEYQSGKRLHYKSACYFFRVDKEHIIDATRKGGIARFVNHSCSPNCVAKVISVRNEKKVVFFAEREIYPGEEITYDYHFNREDEGKKIPCFCNSKNCRRYLN